MRRQTFKTFVEATDIFGFERDKADPQHADDSLIMYPIKQFDTELMMDFLTKKKIGTFQAEITMPNVIQWGSMPGCVRLEVDTGYRFSVKKLAVDKEGHPRWVTKKLFQLNRNGFGGYEDSVSQEMFEYLNQAGSTMIEAPTEDYDLEPLVNNIYEKLKRTAKHIFIPEGVKKLHDDCYVIKLGVKGQGVEYRDQKRVEQNQTYVTYDRHQGTIRVFNQNLLSKVGGPHSWKISQPSFEHYFFPTQNRDEISETISVFMKYY